MVKRVSETQRKRIEIIEENLLTKEEQGKEYRPLILANSK